MVDEQILSLIIGLARLMAIEAKDLADAFDDTKQNQEFYNQLKAQMIPKRDRRIKLKDSA